MNSLVGIVTEIDIQEFALCLVGGGFEYSLNVCLCVCVTVFVWTVVGFVWSIVCFVKYRWRREEEETRQMYDMVERIIGKTLSLFHSLITET